MQCIGLDAKTLRRTKLNVLKTDTKRGTKGAEYQKSHKKACILSEV